MADEQAIEQILAEDAKVAGATTLDPNASDPKLYAAWQAVEDFLRECPCSLGIEDHGMIRGVTFHPIHGLRLHERGGGRSVHWKEIPNGILRAMLLFLDQLKAQGIAHHPDLAPAEPEPAPAEPEPATGILVEDTAPIPDDPPVPEEAGKPKKARR